MLKSIKYIACFNSTGRTLKNHIKFKPGLTVIKGENESGKSFVLEMIRYALFGSEALRGAKSGYDLLEVDLEIEIKGKLYKIQRRGPKASVNINEAIGTKAVNSYIEGILGYGLTVFDITQNVMQGEIDKLTKNMGPTERRKVIDQITGLSQFEAAEKECRSEANVLRKTAEQFEANLIEPEAPAKPDDYEDSTVLKKRLDEEIRNQTKRDTLVEVDKPEAPIKPEGDKGSIEHERQREVWNSQRLLLNSKLLKLPKVDCEYDKETLQGFKSYLEQESRGPLPAGHKMEDLEQWRQDNINIARGKEIKCQECGAIIEGTELPPRPPLNISEIDEEIRRYNKWVGFKYNYHLVPSPITIEEVNESLEAYGNAVERTILVRQLEDMGEEPEDRSGEALEWEIYIDKLTNYDFKYGEYKKYLSLKKEIDLLPNPEPFLKEKYDMAIKYEMLKESYEYAKSVYEEQLDRCTKIRAKQQHYKDGAEALKEARRNVKQYLVPSLNRVASHLLYQMTDGERKSIKVSEDFDIVVDNQPVSTLSGSGVSIVNLALRIGLGQVLTQAVSPFLLADEVDANMGERRMKATHESLRRLRDELKQVIVVTHKELEGDNEICLI